MLELSIREVRRLALGAQQLAGPAPKRPTKALMLDTIRQLGAVQIDSISVVARSHHLVLWSRLGNHPPEWLDELLRDDRAIFEYWAHAAAFVPIELFPYFRRMMVGDASANGNDWSARTRQWMSENAELLERVVAHVREHGPVCSKTFDPPEGVKRASPWAWYGNKPTNIALDMLWTTGTLMVDRREKFARWYDLRERVYPTWDDADIPPVEEEQRVLGERALRAMGVTTPRWLPDYFRKNWGQGPISSRISHRLLDEMSERGLATRVRVEGLDGDAYVWSDLLEQRTPQSRTTLLSPFDNLIWDRARAKGMFDFFLQLEAYTPAPKRRYGYFSLPILYKDQLVGRLDPKAERKQRHLSIKVLHLEPWFEPKADERFYASLAKTLEDFAAFNQCDTVSVERGEPAVAADGLRAALQSRRLMPETTESQ